ncbi:MAG: 23S rRNA (adenine(2503)-C(2))-methyltransferase RlmN [Oscillospiraceae bacterium]|nr:23S rRNA (adenine(2503)-C(2))-methyltransferase RlmN [Oscillospiraceae bacterium]
MTDLKSLTYPQLEEFMKELGQPAYRTGQVFGWLHQKGVTSFDQMTNLPAALRQTLAEKSFLNSLTVERKLVSKKDGTVKYLFGLRDGECVESVLMDYHHGHSLCISTQVGCRQGCRFCASTLGGLVRNLTPAEMLDEIYTATADSGHRIDSVVLMGIGEPLDNYDNVMAFLELLSDPRGLNLSLRHVSLSTCGLVDRIYDLAEKKLGLTLSISLHGSNDTVRSASMPINNKWNIDALLKACRDYFDTTGRRVSFEYALIEGKNDSPEQARELAALLKGMLCHVNLIPVNPVVERGNRRSSRQAVERFQKTLQSCGVNATVRRELGTDINAACGQLRRTHAQSSTQESEETP